MEERNSRKLACVSLRGLTIFPNMIVHFDLSREISIHAIEEAMLRPEQQIFLVAQKGKEEECINKEQVYEIGTISTIKQIVKSSEGLVRVLVEGNERAYLEELEKNEGEFLEAVITPIEQEQNRQEDEFLQKAKIIKIKEILKQYSTYHPKFEKNLEALLKSEGELAELLDQIGMNLPFLNEQKQAILQEVELEKRFLLVASMLENENELSKIKNELTINIKRKLEENQKEYILREQLKYIKRELQETETEEDGYKEQLEQLEAPIEVKEKIQKSLNRLEGMSDSSSESAVERNYIEMLLELPWQKRTDDSINFAATKKILERDHYGLETVKKRILEFLAVQSLNEKGDRPILCLVGPPGTGKTSIAKSIAASLSKKCVRVSLGGIRDEAEIRGHRKTYVGAMPGRIITSIKQAETKNPVIILDEIDKISTDYRGDAYSALLEVLDREQNVNFRDHYLEVPFDLSEVFFIATANTLDTIPWPLRDRMEIIEIHSYTVNEKFQIAKKYLLPKQLILNGLSKDTVHISDNALKSIIMYYTREAGVRKLESTIASLLRKIAYEIVVDGKEKIRITEKNIMKYLGQFKYFITLKNKEDLEGVVRGLAWTKVGGETLEIEVNKMPGTGNVVLTGQLGDVMKESASAAISYLKSNAKELGISQSLFSECDFHFHIPSGAVPKDGPSAGITMCTALYSLLISKKIKSDIAMTGEITIRGRVLAIGGLKEKLIAAKIAGMKTILIPKDNLKDLEEIEEEVKSGMEIYGVTTMKEVIKRIE
ncbi:MAG: endopeptidase La [Lachnospiraceae bacterium]